MILAKPALQVALEANTIHCDPAPQYIGPNSIDVTLGSTLLKVVPNTKSNRLIDTTNAGAVNKIYATGDLYVAGWEIWPGNVYLGHTAEAIGSDHYVPILETRSTVARHGISIHHAGFGDIGFKGQWTLEIVNHTSYPILLPIGARVGQVYFMQCTDPGELYSNPYTQQSGPVHAKGILDKS